MVSSKIGDGSAIQAKTSSSPKYQLCQTFGLEGETTQPLPSSLRSKPMAWRSQQPQPLLVVLRRGFNPNPRPFPSPGEGMQPLVAPLTSMRKNHPIMVLVAIVCAGFARVCFTLVLYGSLMFVGICNSDAVNIRILNPKKRIENAYTQSGRIANSPERPFAEQLQYTIDLL